MYGLAVYILHVKVLPDTPQREVVYSGATKLSDEAQMLADDMLAAYIFNHYNWKYDFLRPTIEQIVQESTSSCMGMRRQRRRKRKWRRRPRRRKTGQRMGMEGKGGEEAE